MNIYFQVLITRKKTNPMKIDNKIVLSFVILHGTLEENKLGNAGVS